MVERAGLPVNVLTLSGGPAVRDLAGVGVARVSTGSLLFRAALGAVSRTAAAVRDGAALPAGIPTYAEAAGLVDG